MRTPPADGTPSASPGRTPAPIVGAELTLALAARRLDALRWAAILGGEYDPDVFDDAVVEYRTARAGLRAALLPARPDALRYALSA